MSTKKKEKKQLLNEGTIRHFMKLANLGPLSETFVSHMREDGLPGEDEEEEEDEFGGEPEIEGPIGGEEGELPPEAEVEAPASGGGNEAFVQDLVTAIANAVAEVSGVEVEVEGGEGGEGEFPGEEMGDEMGGEMPAEMPTPEEEEGLPGEEEEEEEIVEEKSCAKGKAGLAAKGTVKGLKEDEKAGLASKGKVTGLKEEEKLKKAGLAAKGTVKGLKEDETIVSGDRVEQSADQRELPAHDQVVEEELKESKKKLSKEQLIKEVVKRVLARVTKKGKK